MHDDERPRVAGTRGIGLGEIRGHGRVERCSIDSVSDRAEIDPLAFGPKRLGVGRRLHGKALRLLVQFGLARAIDQRAAEPLAIDRRLRGKTIGRCGHALSVAVDRFLEEAQQLVAGTGQVFGFHVFGRAARHEHAAAQELGADT